MSGDEHMTVELRLAKAYREEGEQLRKEAAADLEAARYERGQVAHAERTMADRERGIVERERWLEQHDEAKVRAIVAEAEAKLTEAKALLAEFNSTRHGAARALVEINEREKAARQKVA